MKIWVVSFGEPLSCDGPNVRLRRGSLLAEYLSDKEHNVTFFSSSFDHYNKVQRSMSNTTIDIIGKYKLKLVYARGYKNNVSIQRVRYHAESAREINKLMLLSEKPDVILIDMNPLEISRVVINFGFKHNIPTILDIRDLWPDIFSEVVPGILLPIIIPYIWLKRFQLSKTIVKATAITALTDDYLKYGLNYAHRTRSLNDRIFHMAYKKQDSNDLKLKFHDIWGKYNLKYTDFIVVFIGNFGKQYVFEPILYAANKLMQIERIKFVLCGVGENLEIIKKETRNNNNIIFPGWISGEEISSIMSVASLGLAPYRNCDNFTKNIPNKFAEYLSLGLPIIIGIKGVMLDIIVQNQCGAYYRNGQELKDKILMYFNDAEKISVHSENCKSLFETDFNADVVYNNFATYVEGFNLTNHNT